MVIGGRTSRGFEVEEKEHGRVLVVRFLDQDLSYYHADALRRDLRGTIENRARRGARWICFDMGRVRVIDSGGIGLVLTSHNRCADLGATLALLHTTPFVRHVLGIVGAHRHVRMFGTLEEAIEAMRKTAKKARETEGDDAAKPDLTDT